TVRTDYILFIAAGAFHGKKPSDLIPELQGRFPVRVELSPLGRDDYKRILTHPRNALTKQYQLLLAAEQVNLIFEESGLDAIAEFTAHANTTMQDIGARRLHTIMEKILENISFEAPERRGQTVRITAAEVRASLQDILKDEDLSRFVL
ncbi:MAG: AAA family ATPase, partial [Planctomycetota bacterium]|nr:AAA family ATPase [Planctomycetota bacterium]